MPARDLSITSVAEGTAAGSLHLNVHDYGAVGDGVTDNIAAIEAASAVIAANARGGTLFFPSGIYMISTAWSLPDKCHIRGAVGPTTNNAVASESLGSTIRLMAGFTWLAYSDVASAVDSTGNQVTIENITFDTAESTLPNPPSSATQATAVLHTNGLTRLANVRIRGVKSAGARKIWGMRQRSGGTNVRATNLMIYSCDQGLAHTADGSGFYESCYFGNCTNQNLYIGGGWGGDGHVTFSNCLIDETFGSQASCEIASDVTDVVFSQCLFFGSTGIPSLKDAGTRSVFTACRFKPYAANTGNIALSISGTGGKYVGCHIASSTGQAHISWGSTADSGMFVGCTFGTGTGETGGGKGWYFGYDTANAFAQKTSFYNVAPVAQPAANADTSGATLAALETEVNELKATLRSLGLIST